MAGQVRKIIDEIIEKNAGGDLVLENTTKVKIQMKGISLGEYNEISKDDPEDIQKLRELADDLGIELEH